MKAAELLRASALAALVGHPCAGQRTIEVT